MSDSELDPTLAVGTASKRESLDKPARVVKSIEASLGPGTSLASNGHLSSRDRLDRAVQNLRLTRALVECIVIHSFSRCGIVEGRS